jgi:hypothetical protein
MLRASRSDAGPTSAPFKKRGPKKSYSALGMAIVILSTDYRFYAFNLDQLKFDQLKSEQTKCCPVDLEDGDTQNSMVGICPLLGVRHVDTVYRAIPIHKIVTPIYTFSHLYHRLPTLNGPDSSRMSRCMVYRTLRAPHTDYV